MQFIASTVSLTVDDVAASQAFFTAHLGYTVQQAADGFASLTRDDAFDVVLLARGIEVLQPEITMPLREEPWGERLFQVTDPNGVIVQFVEWSSTPSE
ncbi:MAG: glyoxalase [Nonomuraea sp.]|nr:glyoxalase [Nonomuraea sp.]